jgi:hypothetical protein
MQLGNNEHFIWTPLGRQLPTVETRLQTPWVDPPADGVLVPAAASSNLLMDCHHFIALENFCPCCRRDHAGWEAGITIK